LCVNRALFMRSHWLAPKAATFQVKARSTNAVVSSFMRWPTISLCNAHAGDAGADQGLVAKDRR
jgi:hypothetical protein